MDFSFINVKSKTFWTGLIAVIGAIGGYMTGDIALGPAVAALFVGLQTIFIRDAITKLEK